MTTPATLQPSPHATPKWRLAVNLLLFTIGVGLLPILFGLSVNLGARFVSAPKVGETYFYWLFTSYHYSVYVALLLGAGAVLLLVLWIAGRVMRQKNFPIMGWVVGAGIYLACLATGFAVPSLVSGNIHTNSVQLDSRVYHLSEWYGSASNDGFFAIWQCDGMGFACKPIKQFTLREYGQYRLPYTKVALLADAENGALSVEVDGNAIFSEKP